VEGAIGRTPTLVAQNVVIDWLCKVPERAFQNSSGRTVSTFLLVSWDEKFNSHLATSNVKVHQRPHPKGRLSPSQVYPASYVACSAFHFDEQGRHNPIGIDPRSIAKRE
jgi:hypothetical protein